MEGEDKKTERKYVKAATHGKETNNMVAVEHRHKPLVESLGVIDTSKLMSHHFK